jgi:anti-sigma regulatory factor (Ser/Thr protein kinase)/serine/threonine protein phosphatase PrpC
MEPIRNSVVVVIDEATRVAAARRAAGDLCLRLDLDPEVIARAELITVELANNLLQHARSGHLFFSSTTTRDAIEIVSIDHGPGIPSVPRALTDGYSTGVTPGFGLGAIQRQAQAFHMFSTPGKGTVAAARVGSAGRPYSPVHAVESILCTPIQGETSNGDSWAIHNGPRRTVYLLADGLGHGLFASEASILATSIFTRALDRDPNLPLAELLQQMHMPMRATRGAAIAMFAIEHPAAPGAPIKATGCGVGNINCIVQAPDGSSRPLVSHNGTVGHQMRRVQEFSFSLLPGSLLILHSDGLSTHWKLSQYPGLELCSPAVIAGVLYRDAARGRDDATVLVARLSNTFTRHELQHTPEAPIHG